MSRITVIGGGLTGLTAAYRLSQASNARVTLLEAAPRAGGWARTHRVPVEFQRDGKDYAGEVVVEAGPRSIRPRGSLGSPAMLKLIIDLGLSGEIISIPNSHPAAKNRYLLDPDTLELSRVNTSPLELLVPRIMRMPAALEELLLAFAMEPFKGRSRPMEDESVAEFFTRRFGADVAQTASAFVHGIFAADPAKLSLRSAFPVLDSAEQRYGGVVMGMLLGPRDQAYLDAEKAGWAACGELGEKRKDWSMYALKNGMEMLPRALRRSAEAAGVDIRRDAAVERLTPNDEGVQISLAGGEILEADHVVAAIPSSKLSDLISAPLPHLNANSSTTVGVVNVIIPLPPSQVHPPGFGYLIPRGTPGSSPEGVLGVVFDSTALPGVGDGALEGQVTKLTLMMGGPHWSSYDSGNGSPLPVPKSADDLVELAIAHLHRVSPLLKAENVPMLVVPPHLNVDCIPTYAPGHASRLHELHEAMSTGPWRGRLSVAGAAYGGPSVNDCVFSGESVANALKAGQVTTGLERWQ